MLNAPFQSPTDLRSLASALRQRGRTGTLTRDDIDRYCDWILENAAEWERQQRSAACLPLLKLLGFAVPRHEHSHTAAPPGAHSPPSVPIDPARTGA